MTLQNIDEKVMDALLSEDGVKENVEQMTPGELDLFKHYLVRQGTYARYALECQKKQVAGIVSPKKKKRKRHKRNK